MGSTKIKKKKAPSLWGSIDWLTIFIYVVLLALGWMSVCGACYDFELEGSILDFSTRSGMQIVWIGSSLILAFLILMIDDRVIESFSYIIYIGFLALLFATPFLAHDIKGSMSWIKLGNFSVQPAEFAKFGVALCLAKVMSTYGFDVRKWRDLLICIVLIAVPMALIVIQKETGSALVYSAFFLMLYREGMPGSFLFTALSLVVYFVVGVRFADDPLWGVEQMSLVITPSQGTSASHTGRDSSTSLSELFITMILCEVELNLAKHRYPYPPSIYLVAPFLSSGHILRSLISSL